MIIIDGTESKLIVEYLETIILNQEKMMKTSEAIQEVINSFTEKFNAIGVSIDGIATDVANLILMIQSLQTDRDMSPEEIQQAIAPLISKAGEIKTRLENLDAEN